MSDPNTSLPEGDTPDPNAPIGDPPVKPLRAWSAETGAPIGDTTEPEDTAADGEATVVVTPVPAAPDTQPVVPAVGSAEGEGADEPIEVRLARAEEQRNAERARREAAEAEAGRMANERTLLQNELENTPEPITAPWDNDETVAELNTLMQHDPATALKTMFLEWFYPRVKREISEANAPTNDFINNIATQRAVEMRITEELEAAAEYGDEYKPMLTEYLQSRGNTGALAEAIKRDLAQLPEVERARTLVSRGYIRGMAGQLGRTLVPVTAPAVGDPPPAPLAPAAPPNTSAVARPTARSAAPAPAPELPPKSAEDQAGDRIVQSGGNEGLRGLGFGRGA